MQFAERIDKKKCTWDAPEVAGYGKTLGVIPSKLTVNVLKDDVMKYGNFQVCITVCSEINSFERLLPSLILRLIGGALKT